VIMLNVHLGQLDVVMSGVGCVVLNMMRFEGLGILRIRGIVRIMRRLLGLYIGLYCWDSSLRRCLDSYWDKLILLDLCITWDWFL
jgi:hypothetical protein